LLSSLIVDTHASRPLTTFPVFNEVSYLDRPLKIC